MRKLITQSRLASILLAVLFGLVVIPAAKAQTYAPEKYVREFKKETLFQYDLPDANATNYWKSRYGDPTYGLYTLDWKAGQDSTLNTVSGGFNLVYLYDENGPILDEYGYPMQDILYVTNRTYTFWPSNTTGIAYNYQQGVLASTNSASPLAAPSTWIYHKGSYDSESSMYEPLYYIHETADIETKIDLYTGGTVGETNNVLFAIHFSGYDAAGAQAITDYTGIQILGTNLDTNGVLWTILPQHQIADITPTLPSAYTNYTFSLNPSDYVLRIVSNGQQMTGTLDISAGAPVQVGYVLQHTSGTADSITVTNIQWSIPTSKDVAISNLVYGTDFGYAAPISTNSLTSNTVSFYWVSGGIKTISLSLKANGKELTASGTFNVYKPDRSFTLSPYNTVTVDSNHPFSPAIALHFGHSPPGVVSFMSSNPASGDWQWLQKTTYSARLQDAADNQWYKAAGIGLDTAFPYPETNFLGGMVDSPIILLPVDAKKTEINHAFELSLMYRPPVSNAIYVPIAKVDWDFSASATNTTPGTEGGWQLITNSVVIPTNTINSTTITTHPEWTNNWINFRNNFNLEN